MKGFLKKKFEKGLHSGWLDQAFCVLKLKGGGRGKYNFLI